MTRFIFITGGVVSSLGKGLCSAALGALLQARGFKVRLRKLDPYLNVDPGTMSPYQHGEVFVTDDGAETDLDLGHYERYVGVAARKKIALFCNLRESRVIPAIDVDTIYAVPGSYHAEGFDREVCAHFGLQAREPDLSRWNSIVDRIRRPEGEVNIAIVGKYTHLPDSYKSLAEAMTHGGIANNVRVKLDWINSEVFETESEAVQQLEGVHAILVPGGFGERGSEGKIEAARFARERNVPYFGICFGMQMAVIEAARHLDRKSVV